MDPILGEITLYKSEQDYRSHNLKQAEYIKMVNIMCIWGPSGRQEMMKNGIAFSLEINFQNETILMMGAHDRA
jgi:hypothetical protein